MGGTPDSLGTQLMALGVYLPITLLSGEPGLWEGPPHSSRNACSRNLRDQAWGCWVQQIDISPYVCALDSPLRLLEPHRPLWPLPLLGAETPLGQCQTAEVGMQGPILGFHRCPHPSPESHRCPQDCGSCAASLITHRCACCTEPQGSADIGSHLWQHQPGVV